MNPFRNLGFEVRRVRNLENDVYNPRPLASASAAASVSSSTAGMGTPHNTLPSAEIVATSIVLASFFPFISWGSDAGNEERNEKRDEGRPSERTQRNGGRKLRKENLQPPDRTIRRAPNKLAASLHWRSADRSPETEFLLAAQGIQGIIQMISYQDVCATTLDFHPALPEDPEIRVKLRIVMEKHGASVWNFTSRYQAIAAIRDAISAHKELLMRGVIHRDISAQNILLGRADAPDGLRGILTHRPRYGYGTRTYQSVSILMSADPENHPIPPHDYLDDLESFFYVTTHLILSFKGPGECVKSPPVFFSYWDDLDARAASASKSTLVRGGFHAHFFPAYWGEACKTLVRGFQAFIKAVINEKIEIRFSEIGEDERARRWDALVGEDLDTNYARVDELFRVALENIVAEDSKAVVPTKPSMPREAVNSQRNLKRMLGEETAEDPLRKRTRRRA
ncbi:hypothetical protein DFP72DRAFT_843048 [Ephemerocybe angulata]|uniref:Fungal-type protein kinase domain-containing protein n=1 Tax=Ephemerocybe angulata TaxID=980116 RepID=A0A8H6MD53_9AGAR|nr:hypothetical protein DFP72DRAFT_843048 [Tulosesus angulatus]